jgi:hypothetical protein
MGNPIEPLLPSEEEAIVFDPPIELEDVEGTAFTLTLRDRCDASANRVEAAQVAVWLDEEGEPLLFCGHHYSKHESSLAAIAVRVHDQRAVAENRQQGDYS